VNDSLFPSDQPPGTEPDGTFDPTKMRAARDAPPTPPRKTTTETKPLSVSQLNAAIAHSLKDAFPAKLRVLGEVSGLKRQTHAYFTLKDQDAACSCVMFAPALKKLDAPFEDGQSVIATGRIDHWTKAGRTQLYVDSITPVGKGALEAQLRALIDRARAEGWLDPERKRPLPTFPRAVAIITSRTGAALQDVIDTARRRCPAVDLLIIDCRVQGDAASQQITQRLRAIHHLRKQNPIDAVILTRGGGSIEDLWAFNDEAVARAIMACPVPVVAAIGHETDTTLAELVADARAATPTQAAMRLTPDRAALAEHTAQLSSRLTTALARALTAERRHLTALARLAALADPAHNLKQATTRRNHAAHALRAAARHRLASTRRTLDRLAARLERHRPAALYARREACLHEAAARLRRALAARLAQREHLALADDLHAAARERHRRAAERLNALERELVLASPIHVLRRGYSVTTTADGRVVRTANQLKPGDLIRTRLADGQRSSTVNEQSTDAPPPAAIPDARLPKRAAPQKPNPPRRQRRKPKQPTDRDQLGLF